MPHLDPPADPLDEIYLSAILFLQSIDVLRGMAATRDKVANFSRELDVAMRHLDALNRHFPVLRDTRPSTTMRRHRGVYSDAAF